jgi:hypothetical protein
MGAGTHAHDCEACEDGTVPVPRSDLAAERLAALLDAERENTALRTKVADYRRMIDGLETAAHEERAAVAAWLRRRALVQPNVRSVLLMGAVADAIERGEHRREEPR